MRNDADYNKFAKAIVHDYRNDLACDLRSGVIKIANDLDLNPNETRRLVEKTNLTAHLSFFDKTSQDNYVEFDVVDPDDVMGELFGRVEHSGEGSEKVAHELHDYHSMFRTLNDDTSVKLASIGGEQEELTPHEREYVEKKAYRAKAAQARRVNNLRDVLTSKLGQAEQEYAEKVANIVHCTRGLYAHNARDVVEDALVLHGARAHQFVVDVVKVAKLDTSLEVNTDRYISDKSWHGDISEALDLFDTKQKIATALNALDQ